VNKGKGLRCYPAGGSEPQGVHFRGCEKVCGQIAASSSRRPTMPRRLEVGIIETVRV